MVRGIELAWMPVAAAVGSLGVSKQRVYQLIACGRLGSMRVNGTWLVRWSDVLERADRLGRGVK
jgi:hypothetical protein